MHARAIIAAILAALGVPSLAADAAYVETTCSTDSDGTLSVQLASLDGARRQISFRTAPTKGVVFHGTTVADFKWFSQYEKFKEAVLHLPNEGAVVGMLQLVSIDGKTKALGWVSSACWQQLQETTKGALSTRRQSRV